ncbi:MAG: GGDEF domain-containing protein [Terriglobia bacterium]
MAEATELLAGSGEARLRKLERRGLWFLLLNLLGLILLTVGLVELLYPQMLESVIPFRLKLEHLALLLFGFLAIILLSDILTLTLRGTLRRARAEMVDEMSRHDAAAKLTLMDAVTGTFDKRYLEEIIPRETNRADRRESTLTFIKFTIEGFDGIEGRLGPLAPDRVLQGTAGLLKKSFRPTDIIVRYAPSEFIVMMPETAKQGALTAVRRLLTKVDEWNRNKVIPGFELQLMVGVSDYTKGKDVRDSLVALDTRVQMYRDKEAQA